MRGGEGRVARLPALVTGAVAVGELVSAVAGGVDAVVDAGHRRAAPARSRGGGHADRLPAGSASFPGAKCIARAPRARAAAAERGNAMETQAPAVAFGPRSAVNLLVRGGRWPERWRAGRVSPPSCREAEGSPRGASRARRCMCTS